MIHFRNQITIPVFHLCDRYLIKTKSLSDQVVLFLCTRLFLLPGIKLITLATYN